ncbi:ABC1 kinase family protein [Sporobolomyces koalae]|uniref:ABC1 kinase family protein n=1 Tax=Sporobolomyces koalae TaxID=500713 RepID=UPI003178136F
MFSRSLVGLTGSGVRSSCLSGTRAGHARGFPRPSIVQLRLSSGTATAAPKKAGRRWKGLAAAGAIGTGVFLYDRYEGAEALRRSLRTLVFGLTLAIDFKLNFSPDNPEGIDALHERTAKRLQALCETNQGMYIKLAQSLAIQAAILPKPYREAFANVFDAAPGVEWEEVVKVFRAEFGCHPDDAFDSFQRTPVASASIAQVHKARLKVANGQAPWKDDEGWVAVKVRKPAVPKQMEWDLFCYRALLWSYEKIFDLPVSFISKYVTEQMRKEANLVTEAHNAERTAEYLKNEPTLKKTAMVPTVYWDWTGPSVMTADFISACRLTDKKRLAEYGLSVKETMDAVTELYSAMVFKWGWVQADPHPGNILVRPNAKRPKHPEIVLIDHGLYVDMPTQFRHQYCQLWRSLFTGQISEIEKIAVAWGIKKENADIFASLTLLRPHKLKKQKGAEAPTEAEKKFGEQTRYEQQVGLKARLKTMLESEELIPRELIFVTRGLRMLQANNQAMGSPSNRINIHAHYAADGLAAFTPADSRTLSKIGLKSYAVETLRLVIFRVVLFAVDAGFQFTRLRSWFIEKVLGGKGEGLEDLLQRQVTDMARNEFGVELDDAAFSG